MAAAAASTAAARFEAGWRAARAGAEAGPLSVFR
jgi:hypothetical protein